jgi:hypothetical protein
MRKLLRAVALGVTALIVLTGCAGGVTGSQERTVTVWTYPAISDDARHRELWANLISRFNETNPGVRVDVEIFPWAKRDEALQTAITSDTGPDLVYLVPDQLSSYEAAIEPMNAYLGQERASSLLPNVAQAVTAGDSLLGAPLLTSSNPLVCNAAAFRAAGVVTYPSTWEDVTEMAPLFTEKGMYALTYSADPGQTLNMSFYPLLWQAGGSVFDADEQVAFNSPQGIRALEFLTGLARGNALEPDSLTTAVNTEQTEFAAGRSGCTWSIPAVDLVPVLGEENVVVLPPLKDERSVAYGTVGSLSLLKSSRNKEVAGRFAAFVTDPVNSVDYLRAGGYFSPTSGTAPLYAGRPVQSRVEQTLPNVRFGEPNHAARQVMGVLSPEIQAALLGQKSPQQALTDAAEAAKPLLR